MNPKCVSCSKTVYPLEKLTIGQDNFHRACFKCKQCGSTLRPGLYAIINGQYYCKNHKIESNNIGHATASTESTPGQQTAITRDSRSDSQNQDDMPPLITPQPIQNNNNTNTQPIYNNNTARKPSDPAPLQFNDNLLSVPNMPGASPEFTAWQNKQLDNFMKSLEVARRTMLKRENCANCNVVIPLEDNCGMKDGRIYCSKCLNTPLVLLGMFKHKK